MEAMDTHICIGTKNKKLQQQYKIYTWREISSAPQCYDFSEIINKMILQETSNKEKIMMQINPLMAMTKRPKTQVSVQTSSSNGYKSQMK